MTSTAAPAGSVPTPFRDALALTEHGDGRYTAEVGPVWAVGEKAHGGMLMALLARAALAALGAGPDGAALEPLAVSAQFLRAPDVGAVELRADVLKRGRTASVAAVLMSQGGRPVLAGSVTAGRLADEEPRHAVVPAVAAVPPPGAADPAGGAGAAFAGLAGACELRLDPATTAFARGERAEPVLRGWARPRGEDPDVLFALLAGDILPPTVFNVGGHVAWAPTVQMTALLRARPVPGWLALEARAVLVAGQWFDEDVTVVDEAGRVVAQVRQLALAPLGS